MCLNFCSSRKCKCMHVTSVGKKSKLLAKSQELGRFCDFLLRVEKVEKVLNTIFQAKAWPVSQKRTFYRKKYKNTYISWLHMNYFKFQCPNPEARKNLYFCTFFYKEYFFAEQAELWPKILHKVKIVKSFYSQTKNYKFISFLKFGNCWIHVCVQIQHPIIQISEEP